MYSYYWTSCLGFTCVCWCALQGAQRPAAAGDTCAAGCSRRPSAVLAGKPHQARPDDGLDFIGFRRRPGEARHRPVGPAVACGPWTPAGAARTRTSRSTLRCRAACAMRLELRPLSQVRARRRRCGGACEGEESRRRHGVRGRGYNAVWTHSSARSARTSWAPRSRPPRNDQFKGDLTVRDWEPAARITLWGAIPVEVYSVWNADPLDRAIWGRAW